MSLSDADELFRRLNREIWLLTVCHGESRGGLIATAVMSASIVPMMPRVLVGIARQHATWDLVEAAGRFTLQLLPPSRLDLVERFGMQSGRDVDKFAVDEWIHELSGGPRLKDAIGWLDCRVEAGWDSGDRTVYLAEVLDAAAPAVGQTILTTQQMVADAPSEWLPRLREQLQADAARDAEAIASWRSQDAVRRGRW
ncbi:MAG: flavin reductase [Planctomycetaceae bacterium]|nr:flavin reductase [Planctomycetaceae bacterium]